MMWRTRATAVGGLMVAGGLYLASVWTDQPMGYEFPQVIAIAMLVLAVALMVLAFRGGRPLAGGDEEPVPWRTILPAIGVFLAYLALARTLGFFVTSLLAFVAIALIYTPSRWRWRTLAVTGGVGVGLMSALYLVFVVLLNVQLPSGLLV